MSKLKLFCFPHAGGSATSYYRWNSLLEDVDVIPVELAGRGLRAGESFYGNFSNMVEDTYKVVKDKANDGPYAFFGHSMGSWLGYELAHKLIQNGYPSPSHIVVSARRAPHCEYDIERNFGSLTRKELIEQVLSLGGTPPELFENEQLLNHFLTIIEHDFKVISDYTYHNKETLLECGITVMAGKQDIHVSTKDLLAWKRHTTGFCKVLTLEGGHFYLNENEEVFLKILSDSLTVKAI
ncbi:thioesterase II family protein [Fictibacillus nanhaiensis]|uniref:thioesterase II family protein n=1 Tax=Fictibacillus nanhaiensis TaxID=742169 RepID=UPI003C1A3048